MGDELAGWAAFAGAILAISLEVRRARVGTTAPGGAINTPALGRADRFVLTRGVSAFSVLIAVVIGLSAYALSALSVALQMDAQYTRDCVGETCFGTTLDQLDAAKLDLAVSVVDVIVVVLWCAVAVLSLRIALYTTIRACDWVVYVRAERESEVERDERSIDEERRDPQAQPRLRSDLRRKDRDRAAKPRSR